MLLQPWIRRYTDTCLVEAMIQTTSFMEQDYLGAVFCGLFARAVKPYNVSTTDQVGKRR